MVESAQWVSTNHSTLIRPTRAPRQCSVATQGDFDVRWLRGSASDLIFAPWLRAIEKDGGRVLGGKRVSTVQFRPPTSTGELESGEGDEGVGFTKQASTERGREGARGVRGVSLVGDVGGDDDVAAVRVETLDGDVFEADAVVLAVGITAAKVHVVYVVRLRV